MWAACFSAYWLGYKGLLNELILKYFPYCIPFMIPSSLMPAPSIALALIAFKLLWFVGGFYYFGKNASKWYYESSKKTDSTTNPSSFIRGTIANGIFGGLAAKVLITLSSIGHS